MIQYSIPSYNRPKKTFLAALSAHSPCNKSNRRTIHISENGPSDPLLTSMLRSSLSIPSETVEILYQNRLIDMCSNWLAAINMGSGNIVKLLFSDDTVLAEPRPHNLATLSNDPNCVGIVSPVTIDFGRRNELSYYLSSLEQRFRGNDYISLMLQRPDLVSISPCAYYFKRQDFARSLEYVLSLDQIKECIANGAGIDSLSIMTLLSKEYSYIIYDPSALMQYGAGADSITMKDLRHGTNQVQKNRAIAHRYLANVGQGTHYAKFKSFFKEHR